MNRKQLVILLVLVVVLGVAGLMVYQKNQTSWQGGSRQGAGAKLLGDLPVNDVAAIEIKGGTNVLDLIKKDNLWRVKQRQDYPANFSEISGFLLKAADLKAAQSEEIGPSHLARYKLLPPGPGTNTAILVELRDQGGKPIKLQMAVELAFHISEILTRPSLPVMQCLVYYFSFSRRGKNKENRMALRPAKPIYTLASNTPSHLRKFGGRPLPTGR